MGELRGANRMLKSVGSNWIVSLVSLAVAYILTPFLVRTLGNDGYGTWMVITSLTGYLALLVLGVPMASVRYFAEHVAEGRRDKMNRAIGSCTGLYLLIGAVAALAGIGLFGSFVSLYDIPATWVSDARLAFVLVIVYISVGFSASLPDGIMAAHHDFVVRNRVSLAIMALRLGLCLIVLRLLASLTLLALIQLATLAAQLIISLMVVRSRYAGLHVSLRDFEWGTVRKILSFSIFVLLLNVGGRLSFYTDSLVIGASLDVGSIPYYTVANSFFIYLLDFVLAIAAVVMPTATKLKTAGKTLELREVFLRWSKISLSLTLLAVLFLYTLGPRFIGWWIAPSFEGPAGEVLQILMLSSLLFMPVRGVAQPILMGLGKAALPALTFLAVGILNLVLSLLLVHPLGLAGVALGTAIPNVLFGVVILGLACRELQTSPLAYVRYVFGRAFLGAIPVLGLLVWFERVVKVKTLPGLAAAGVSMLMLFVVVWVFFVYWKDPYFHTEERVWRLLRSSKA
jgi:O-antigen/teichoic acid export membrane protein